jgi:hypothetical protein
VKKKGFVARLFIEKFLLADDDDSVHVKNEEENFHAEFFPFHYFSNTKVANDFPHLLQNKMDESTWEEICQKIHFIFDMIVNLKKPAPDRCIKMIFIILGFLFSTLYWSISLIIFNDTAEHSNGEINTLDSKISYIILAICTAIGLFTCIKICYG